MNFSSTTPFIEDIWTRIGQFLKKEELFIMNHVCKFFNYAYDNSFVSCILAKAIRENNTKLIEWALDQGLRVRNKKYYRILYQNYPLLYKKLQSKYPSDISWNWLGFNKIDTIQQIEGLNLKDNDYNQLWNIAFRDDRWDIVSYLTDLKKPIPDDAHRIAWKYSRLKAFEYILTMDNYSVDDDIPFFIYHRAQNIATHISIETIEKTYIKYLRIWHWRRFISVFLYYKRLDIIEWALSKGCVTKDVNFIYSHDNFDCFVWAIEKGFTFYAFDVVKLSERAMRDNKLYILQYLHDHKLPISIHVDLTNTLETFLFCNKWRKTKKNYYKHILYHTLTENKLDILEYITPLITEDDINYVIERFRKAPVEDATKVYYMWSSMSVKLLKYLVENIPKLVIPELVVFSSYVYGNDNISNNINTLKYLYELGHKPTPHSSLHASSHGNLDIIAWLHEVKAEFHPKCIEEAYNRGHINIIGYLLENELINIQDITPFRVKNYTTTTHWHRKRLDHVKNRMYYSGSYIESLLSKHEKLLI